MPRARPSTSCTIIYAFRVIVDTIPDCYNVLGHIHDLFSLVPGRFKDYISTPKPNMYQSLHTTVIGSAGHPLRGADPHLADASRPRNTASPPTGSTSRAPARRYGEGQFEWVRRLLESQQDSDAEEFVQSMKIDMFDDEVFVFTPKGRGHLPARRLHAHRLCLRHPFRRGQST